MVLGRRKTTKKEEYKETENRRKNACMAHKAEIAIEQPFPHSTWRKEKKKSKKKKKNNQEKGKQYS